MTDPIEPSVPGSYFIGQDINWDCPWIDVMLWVELPFWLMVGNITISLEVGGHVFDVAIQENYFELHVGVLTDSKQNVIYRGPMKQREQYAEDIRQFSENHPDVPLMWRKAKTVLKIKSRCNEHVWNITQGQHQDDEIAFQRASNSVRLYLTELCRAHIPVVNKVIQKYRLATYDYFPYEVAPWDVPFWTIERNGKFIRSWLVPYRGWDLKPKEFAEPFSELLRKKIAGEQVDPPNIPYKLIEEGDLLKFSLAPAPGEFELLDALNLMERGDYSGAVRRVTTALEVIVESVAGKAVEAKEGKRTAVKFLRATETNFPKRVEKYEEVAQRSLSIALKKEMSRTRKLRHRIVHNGYRIEEGERGQAQRAVDTGRWIYNWFENDIERRNLREKKIAHRSLGRDMTAGVFPTKITPDGVVVSMFHHSSSSG